MVDEMSKAMLRGLDTGVLRSMRSMAARIDDSGAQELATQKNELLPLIDRELKLREDLNG